MLQDPEFADYLYYNYDNFKEKTLKHRRFKHSDIIPLIEQLKDKNIYTVNKAGKSAGGRDIYLISFGSGKTKVFLWSQMHGDEPTATQALFDIFNFLNSGHLHEIREYMLDKLTFYIMPMVNPDGAEVFERRNISHIDINRDAVRQQTPEGRILRNTFETLKADFGFNLHDQSTRYSVANSAKPATLSFLAPTVDYEKSLNPVRENAIKLIGVMYNVLSKYIPGHIAKYSDEFEPRAFGDNFQKWGTSTILIESGGWKDDPEKQFIRKMNFIGILSALKSIAEGTYNDEPLETYDSIPLNDKFLVDILLKNLTFSKGGVKQIIDIGINLDEVNTSGGFYHTSTIEDIGDLSVFYGYEEFDLTGCEVIPGKTYNKEFGSIREIENIDFNDLHSKGFTNVILNSNDYNEKYTKVPLNITKNRKNEVNDSILTVSIANLIVKHEGQVKYAIVNGFIHDLSNSTSKTGNGLVF